MHLCTLQVRKKRKKWLQHLLVVDMDTPTPETCPLLKVSIALNFLIIRGSTMNTQLGKKHCFPLSRSLSSSTYLLELVASAVEIEGPPGVNAVEKDDSLRAFTG